METKLASGLVLGLLLTANSPVAAHSSSKATSKKEPARITIGVYDYASIKPGILPKAEKSAAAILSKADVETAWVACSTEYTAPSNPACAARGDLTHLTLRILPESMSRRLRSASGDALGFALLGAELSCDAWVLSDRVKKFAREERLPLERVLAAVIAHEVGHLLLNENAHSKAGLMHAYWSRRELSAIEDVQLLFSDAEGKRIYAGVIARHQAASGAAAEASSSDSRVVLN